MYNKPRHPAIARSVMTQTERNIRMKTLEELYNEVLASEELKKEFLSLKPGEVEGFAAKNGCKASLDEIKAFFEAKKNQTGELSDEELDQVAGGKTAEGWEAILSGFSLGTVCAVMVLVSLGTGDVGTAIEGEGMLCDPDM